MIGTNKAWHEQSMHSASNSNQAGTMLLPPSCVHQS